MCAYPKYLLLMAGGYGSRMGSTVPKQFLMLGNKPLILHTIKRFLEYDPDIGIIVVLNPAHKEQWAKVCSDHSFNIDHIIAKGGRERYHSVLNGLSEIKQEGLVAIHDSVRPLVSMETISACFKTAARKGNAIPVISPAESVRYKAPDKTNRALERDAVMLVQTPQVFRTELIKKAYENPFRPEFTDDASVLESLGITINLVPGNRENIKITRPEDMIFADSIIRVND